MQCSNCGTENPPDRKFCGECGSRFSLRCAKCGHENQPPFKFCGDCGTPLIANQPASVPKRPAPAAFLDDQKLEGERKIVTALFADIEGSTKLEQDLDPEEARAIVDPALK